MKLISKRDIPYELTLGKSYEVYAYPDRQSYYIILDNQKISSVDIHKPHIIEEWFYTDREYREIQLGKLGI